MNKLIYILGPAYSGSTLLGLLLGNHPSIVNLGEVMNLEHDYKDDTVCTCGKPLITCKFWSKVRSEIAINSTINYELLDYKGREVIDSRGGYHKLKLVQGNSVRQVFGEKEIQRYRAKNENFFSSVFCLNTSIDFLVDLSKSPERLEVLLDCESLDIYCIYLKRKGEDVYASTIKRPKRSRASFRFKVLREAIWLNLRTTHEKRIFSSISNNRKIELDWDRLRMDPAKEMTKVWEFLGLEHSGLDSSHVDVSKQHIYVGNRWLFKLTDPIVRIKSNVDNLKLNYSQKLTYRVISFLFGHRG